MYYENPGKEIMRKEFNLEEDFQFPKMKMEAHAMGYYAGVGNGTRGERAPPRPVPFKFLSSRAPSRPVCPVCPVFLLPRLPRFSFTIF
jgi:hypothetical protein